MRTTKGDLKRLERRLSTGLTEAEYKDAVNRHFARRDAVWAASPAGQAVYTLRALAEGRKPFPEASPVSITVAEASQWLRDQDAIDSYHRTHFNEPDGKRLLAWGRNPDEMLEHFIRSLANWPLV